MNLIERDGQALLTVSGTFYLPIAPEVEPTLNAVNQLTVEQLCELLRDDGYSAPVSLHPDRLRHAAMSCAQDAWYAATRGTVPEKLRAAHAERMSRFTEQVLEHVEALARAEENLPKLPPDMSPDYGNHREHVVQLSLPDVPNIYLFLKRPGGLMMTLERLREARDLALYTKILTEMGYEVPPEAPAETVYPAAAGVVQRWWHEAVAEHGALLMDGEIDETSTPLPEAYERDQRSRYARMLTARPKPKEPKPPKPRLAPLPNGEKRPKGRPTGAVKRYVKTAQLPADLRLKKGQSGRVAEALEAAAGPENVPELTARAVAAGLASDKQSPERVTLYYLNDFVMKGYAEVKA